MDYIYGPLFRALTCMCMLGIEAPFSPKDAHQQAAIPTALCSRALYEGVLPSNTLDAVIWLSGIATAPFTSAVSKVHVGAKCQKMFK